MIQSITLMLPRLSFARVFFSSSSSSFFSMHRGKHIYNSNSLLFGLSPLCLINGHSLSLRPRGRHVASFDTFRSIDWSPCFIDSLTHSLDKTACAFEKTSVTPLVERNTWSNVSRAMFTPCYLHHFIYMWACMFSLSLSLSPPSKHCVRCLHIVFSYWTRENHWLSSAPSILSVLLSM